MKLTNYIRDAFINAAMQDVPSTDYDEQLRNLILRSCVSALPAKVRTLWNDKELRGYVCTNSCYYGSVGVAVPAIDRYGKVSLPESAKEQAVELAKKSSDQKQQLHELRSKLKGIAYSCTTRKALAEALPEFVKYLPPDAPDATRQLPVIANVVSDFVKAGWPKGKKSEPVAA